jgi:hypothetical protein
VRERVNCVLMEFSVAYSKMYTTNRHGRNKLGSQGPAFHVNSKEVIKEQPPARNL